MPLLIECACGALVRPSAALAGKKVRCPSCKGVLAVPAVSADSKRRMPTPSKPKVSEPEPDDESDDERGSPRPKKPKNSNRVVVRYKTKANLKTVLPAFLAIGAVYASAVATMVVKNPRQAVATILAGLVPLVGGFGFALAMLFLLPKNTRLVIGSQYVELLSRNGALLGQIPIRNVSGLEATRKVEVDCYGNVRGKPRYYFVVEIRTVRQKDRDTFWPQWKGKRGESIEILDEYEKSLTWIRGRILKQVELHRESRRDGDPR
ncbi:MAG TPA: hypothetical protein VHR72_07970 [Gemmataceae bacterium]|jgi:hypothetical protein|nr:hypothetical protein [Gemmataceae bacterium]